MMNDKIEALLNRIVRVCYRKHPYALGGLDGLPGQCPNCHMNGYFRTTLDPHPYALGDKIYFDADRERWFCEFCFDTVYTPKEYPDFYAEEEE